MRRARPARDAESRGGRTAGGKLRELLFGQSGQVSVEYTLLLGAFGIPMIVLSRLLLSVLAGQYQMVTFLEALPFP